MPSFNFPNFKTYIISTFIFLVAISSTGCQSLVQDVEAVLKHDDVPKFSLEQQDAFRAFENNQFSQAVELFRSAIEIESDPTLKAKLYNGLGSSLNELDRYEEAVAAYEEALELAPQKAQVWVNLGVAQRLAGDYDKALKAYEQALSLNGKLATAHSSIGSLRVLQNKPQQAIQAFQSAIDLDPNIAVTHGNLALALAMVGRYEDAQSSLKRAVALGYDNSKVIQERIQELQKLN